MAEKRRKFSSEEKVRILRRHLLEKVPLSDLCDEYGLHPTVFFRGGLTSVRLQADSGFRPGLQVIVITGSFTLLEDASLIV